MPSPPPETMLTQRELAKVLRDAIDDVRNAVTSSAWTVAYSALADVLERTTLQARTSLYVASQLGPIRVDWLERWLEARPTPSRSEGAGSDVDGRDLEVDRG